MTTNVSMLGQVFNSWTVLERAGLTKSGQMTWRCRCKCGREKTIPGGELRRGRTRQCRSCSMSTHGYTQGRNEPPEYRIWKAMLGRCRNPNDKKYADYGGRGISVCERWTDFANFIADMGPRPSPELSIDRYPNNDGNYEPGNCRWATLDEQNSNKRSTLLLTYQGITKPAFVWARLVGITPGALYQRLSKLSWSAEKALTYPPAKPITAEQIP